MDKSYILANFKGGCLYSFVGGGGKTSIIKSVAEILSAQGYQVIISTTTKLGIEEFKDSTVMVNPKFKGSLQKKEPGTINVIVKGSSKEKYLGFSQEEIEEYSNIPIFQVVLIEADGSRRKPFKVPYQHEPVIPANSARVFLVMGAKVLGEKITEDNTYNNEGVSSFLSPGELVYTPEVFRKIVEGCWQKLLNKYNWTLLINQGDFLEEKVGLINVLEYLKTQKIPGTLFSVYQKKVYHDTSIKIGCLILAAGEGKRMGQPKQLLKYQEEFFLSATIKKFAPFVQETVVTLGYHSQEIRFLIPEIGFKFLEIAGYQGGMGASLREGAKAFTNIEALLVVSCDLPLLSKTTIKAIIDTWLDNREKTIVPSYQGRRGHPVLFPIKELKLFSKIKGDEGARNILKEMDLLESDLADPGVIADIDTRKEYENINNKGAING